MKSGQLDLLGRVTQNDNDVISIDYLNRTTLTPTGDIVSGGDINSGNDITSVNDINSGNDITSVGDINSGNDITSVGDINSGNDITSVNDINSGNDITSVGDIISGNDITSVGDIISGAEVIDGYGNKLSDGGTITLDTTTSVTVGGLDSGSTVDNMTTQELFEAILLKELYPTLTAPSATFTKSPTTTYYKIGDSVNITFTSTFNRGSISPQYTAESEYRSGDVNGYLYTGTSLPTTKVSSTSLTNTQTISNYTVILDSQSWTSKVYYDDGCQPKSNKDNDYLSPLSAGNTSAITQTIYGTLPYYATTSDITTLTESSLTYRLSTASSINVNFVDCSDSDYWIIDIPPCWTITGFADSDGYLGADKANSLNQWSESTITRTINSKTYTYKRYSYGANSAPKLGARTVTIGISYSSGVI